MAGDLNLHHRAWLHYSNGDTPLGRELHEVTSRLGLCQIVRGPTRNEYLLDLTLTDCSDAKAEVCAKITDHSLVLTTLRTSVPHSKEHERIVWQFNKADWEGLDAAVKAVPWSRIMSMTPDEGAEFLTDTTLAKVKEYIPTRRITERASSHPWLTINVIAKIRQKKEAEGTSGEKEAAEACSQEIMTAFRAFTDRMKTKLQSLPRGSKAWWRLSRRLALDSTSVGGISHLRDTSGKWLKDGKEKADLLASTFAKKFVLGVTDDNA